MQGWPQKNTKIAKRNPSKKPAFFVFFAFSCGNVGFYPEKEMQMENQQAKTHLANQLLIFNSGRCGQNSGIVRETFDADVIQRTPKPDYVLIYIGMNDVINDQFFTPLDTYIENMKWMIEAARMAEIIPVICTLHPVVDREVYKVHAQEKFGNETVTGKMDRYNTALRKLAAAQKVGLADFSAAAGRVPQSDFLSQDGVHLSPAGNRLLARTFFAVIAPQLRGHETIVCCGDSLTYGYQNAGAGTADGETYPAMLRLLPVPATSGGGVNRVRKEGR